MEFRSVYITARDAAEARLIGRLLVTEKLAACASYFPVSSIYRWQGEIAEEPEFALILKTRATLVEPLIARVRAVHSYAVPCVVSWIIDCGSPPYLDWISASTLEAKSI